MSSIPHPAVLITGTGATFNLFRLAGDLVSTASAREIDKDTTYSSNSSSGSGGGGSKRNGTSGGSGYGTTGKGGSAFGVSVVGNGKGGSYMNPSSEVQPLLLSSKKDDDEETGGGFGSGDEGSNNGSIVRRRLPTMSLLVHCILLCYFLTACILNALRSHRSQTEDETGYDHNSIDPFGDALFDAVPLGWCCGAIFVGILMNVRDPRRERFGRGQRILYSLCAVLLLIGSVTRVYSSSSSTKPTIVDYGTMGATLLFTILSRIESTLCPHPDQQSKEGKKEGSGKKKKTLSYGSLLILLKPYFWPDATSSSAMLNRTRAILTWVCVISSKICGLIGPILIGKAASYLAIYEYWDCAIMVLYYALVQFLKNVFSEGQRLVYLKVGQAAFVQLSEVTFEHLHSLSLDWHLNKKLGDVIRSMDRGISACDELMNWLFLRLLPALVECIVVCIIFATYFNYFPLAVWVFFFVFLYIITTIVLTLWRRQFRQAVVKHDNDWHDICTDSLLNFETVKFFTAETYELKRFGEAVEKYQSGSVSMQASSSLLNNVQLLILQMCLATSLSLTALAIKERMDCCIDLGCTDDIDFTCCADIGGNKDGICPGMDVGDFVAVLTYTLKLFEPLNFLGFVYNRLIMAIIDLTNLSEILAQQPDVIDAKDALLMPSVNVYDPSIVVEFDNVTFHYPSQDDRYNGFKGLSFKLKRGTVTAVVGPTGSGKTTISRLLFRFYDVLGGTIKVNGIDVRSLTQESLHSNIGFVPQQTNMFNDTIRFNVRYGKRDATQEELDQVANDAQLDVFIDSLEDGWETKVGDRGLKLSGGEQQRVAIARCLLKDPPIVVLDEATSALDTLTESSVQDALDRLGSDRTCLVIAHRLGTIRNADNILVLKDGMVNEQGTHDELLALNGTYADMWNMQLHTPKGSSADLMSK